MPTRRSAFTLAELLVSSVILLIVALPVGLVMRGSTGAVQRVDVQREVRGIIDHVLERTEAQDFGVLYDNFGIQPDAAGRIADGIVRGEANPLEIDAAVLARMQELDLRCRLTFRFFTKEEVKVRPENDLRTGTGLLWLQGGVVALFLQGPGVDETVQRTVYCPLILGRPGLLLNQCPAVDPGKKARYDGLGIR